MIFGLVKNFETNKVTKMGEHWKIERKYRRILNKKIAGKVRTQEMVKNLT